jgi:hypothetical protein
MPKNRVERISIAFAIGAAGLLAGGRPAFASIVPADRATVWNPGIPGGVPARTVVCANVNPGGNIQSAINACPLGQVVQLGAGTFNLSTNLTLSKGITLRGMGPTLTKLKVPIGSGNNVITIGSEGVGYATTVNLAGNAVKGTASVVLASNPGLSVSEIVTIDQLTDPNLSKWGYTNCQGATDACRGWFTRMNRPLGQVMEVTAVSGNTVTFSTPFHITFSTGSGAQLTRFSSTAVRNAGVENLYVSGGSNGQGNIRISVAAYSWVKNVESDLSDGASIDMMATFRCVVRDSYVHSTQSPTPGGGGYGISLSQYAADNLVENNAVWNFNKVMVMRATGGGNVIGYNSFEDGWIEGTEGWVETGANASHLTTPHYELFEGNEAFNFDGDNTWGNAIYITVFRNHLTGHRRSLPPLHLSDDENVRAIGLMEGHWWYTFLGNVLGQPGTAIRTYQQLAAPWDGSAMWRLGYNPEDWGATADPKVLSTVLRGANFDYATNSLRWENFTAQTVPDSLYLTSKPAFFGSNRWPWVDPTGSIKLYTLPANSHFVGEPAVNASFYTVKPCRVADTRNAVGIAGGPALASGTTRDFQVTGVCGVPTDAHAVAANVTAVVPGSPGYLSVYPPGTSAATSTINFAAGSTRANSLAVGLGPFGNVSVFLNTTGGQGANFIFDVFGYYK